MTDQKNCEFLYICDVHYGAQPVSRIDNYCSAILNKLDYVLSLASKKNIPLLIGGDLFDTPKISQHRFIQLIELFNNYKDVKILIVRGNHSHDGVPEASPLTILYYCFDNILISDSLDFVDICDMRIVFAPNNTEPMTHEQFVDSSKTNIIMTHHLIVEKPIPFDHYLIENFNTCFDYILLADYHPQQGIIKNGCHTFISPGALARRKNVTSDIERVPSYIHFKNGNIKILELPYNKNVFVDKVIDEKDEPDILDNVKKMIELVDTEINTASLKEALNIFSEKMKTEKTTIDYIQKRLENL